MNARRLMSLALDPARILPARGIVPDPRQRQLLLSADRQILRAEAGEKPIDRDNHPLAALRCFVSRMGARFIARLRIEGTAPQEDRPPQTKKRPRLRLDNEVLWM